AGSSGQDAIVSLMNRTEPSVNATLTPPGCWLEAMTLNNHQLPCSKYPGCLLEKLGGPNALKVVCVHQPEFHQYLASGKLSLLRGLRVDQSRSLKSIVLLVPSGMSVSLMADSM